MSFGPMKFILRWTNEGKNASNWTSALFLVPFILGMESDAAWTSSFTIVVLKYMHAVFVKLHANGRNNPQQCWELLANNVASGCLHGALDKSNHWLVPSLLYLVRTRDRRERDGWWEGGKQKGESLSSFLLPSTPRTPLECASLVNITSRLRDDWGRVRSNHALKRAPSIS